MATRTATKSAASAQQQARELTRRMVASAVAAAEDKKAEDIRILELDPSDSGFTDFFLIASGTNERQVQAIGDAIEMQMKREFSTYANSVEGRRQSEWILLDYVDFVCHIFSAEKRAFYDIERLRKSARQVDLDQLRNTLSEKTTEVREAAAKKSRAKKSVSIKKTTAARSVAKKAAVKKKSAPKTESATATAPKKAVAKKSAKKTAAKKSTK